MIEPGRDLDFSQEALVAYRLLHVGVEDLHGDLAMVTKVGSTVHHARAASRDFRVEAVAALQRSVETLDRGRHIRFYVTVFPSAPRGPLPGEDAEAEGAGPLPPSSPGERVGFLLRTPVVKVLYSIDFGGDDRASHLAAG